MFITDANILQWLPGDIIYDDNIFLPIDMPEGKYSLELAIVSHNTHEPKVKLAISGINEDGWYPMGEILVKK